MNKFINILAGLISEQKRFKFPSDTYQKMVQTTEKLWSMRNKKFKNKTQVGGFDFKTSDGIDGYVKIVINPELEYLGYMDTDPKDSRDPMDFVMELQPSEFESKKNLFLTIYHEMLHATDPSQSTKMSMRQMSKYNEKIDKFYWGHEFEFRTITNEFLEGLVNEFKRRMNLIRKPENIKLLQKSLGNIINHFAKNEKLNKLSLDILTRINDEDLPDSRLSRVLADIASTFPSTSDILKKSEDPYYLVYINTIKEHNPKSWPRFLRMLYNTKIEIESLLTDRLIKK